MLVRYTNLNACRKISLRNETKSEEYFCVDRDVTPFKQKVKNLFLSKENKKRKIEKFVTSDFDKSYGYYYTKDEFSEKYSEEYVIHDYMDTVYIKPRIIFVYNNKETDVMYFDTMLQAQNAFDKIVKYMHENELKFINTEALRG